MASWGAIICQGIVVKSVWTCAQFVPSARNTKLNGLNKLNVESNAVCGIYVLGKIIFFHPLEKKGNKQFIENEFYRGPYLIMHGKLTVVNVSRLFFIFNPKPKIYLALSKVIAIVFRELRNRCTTK